MENQFKERFRKLNPLELVQTFNKDLGHNGWVGSRGEFLAALRQEFNHRNICIDAITHGGAIRTRGFIMKKESEAVYVAKKVIPKKDLTRQIPATLLLDSEYEQHECVYLNPKLVLFDEPIVDMR